MPSLSMVIVTHDNRDAVGRTLPALVDQLRDGDELIVVDNTSSDGTPDAVRELAPSARVIEAGENLGYGGGNNRGAEAASGQLLCFLNPDAVPAPGFRAAIERPLVEGRAWAAWQGLVTAEGGRIVNTHGGVVHFTGISWAGGAGEPLSAPAEGRAAPREGDTSHETRISIDSAAIPMDIQRSTDTARIPLEQPEEPGFVSGACLAVPRSRFLELGGFPDEFFLYHEDVDLSLRLRLAGERLGVEPAARVDHDYEFAKGPAKWRLLERNRWATLIRTYPAALLAVLSPALLLTELALVPAAIAGGWLPQKLAAWGDVLRALPRLLRERREIQAGRAIGAGEFARALRPELDSTYLGRPARWRPLRLALTGYWALALRLLGARR